MQELYVVSFSLSCPCNLASFGSTTSETRTKGLLLEDQEHRVDELDVFDVVVDHVVGNETLTVSWIHFRQDYTDRTGQGGFAETYRSKHGGVADGEEESVAEVQGKATGQLLHVLRASSPLFSRGSVVLQAYTAPRVSNDAAAERR